MDSIMIPEEVAERWRVSVDTIYKMLDRGELRGFKAGRSWRIRLSCVEEAENRQGQAAKYHTT